VGVGCPTSLQRAIKWECEADRSFRVTPRQLPTNSCGESPAILGGCYQPPECPAEMWRLARIHWRIEKRWGGSREVGGRFPTHAHPREKSAPSFADTCIHCLCSPKVWVWWWGRGAVVGAYRGRRISSETGTMGYGYSEERTMGSIGECSGKRNKRPGLCLPASLRRCRRRQAECLAVQPLLTRR
jgi:hypothetical protein